MRFIGKSLGMFFGIGLTVVLIQFFVFALTGILLGDPQTFDRKWVALMVIVFCIAGFLLPESDDSKDVKGTGFW